MQGGKLRLGQAFGVPIYLDASILLIALLWVMPLSGRADAAAIGSGLIVVVLLFLSVLMHEIGHAVAGRINGVQASHIELNGLGGYCAWAGPLPHSAIARLEIILAGPLVNLVLYILCAKLAGLAQDLGETSQGYGFLEATAGPLWRLSSLNLMLLLFNLLPSHPLDGGRALAILLAWPMGGQWAGDRAVAYLGMGVVGLLCLWAFKGNYFILIPALLLFVSNRDILRSVPPRPPLRRVK